MDESCGHNDDSVHTCVSVPFNNGDKLMLRFLSSEYQEWAQLAALYKVDDLVPYTTLTLDLGCSKVLLFPIIGHCWLASKSRQAVVLGNHHVFQQTSYGSFQTRSWVCDIGVYSPSEAAKSWRLLVCHRAWTTHDMDMPWFVDGRLAWRWWFSMLFAR